MFKIDIQFFGGRGAGSYTAGGATVGFGGAMGTGAGGTDMPVAGWTPDAGSRFVDKNNTVKSVENRIKDLDHEQMAIIDEHGYVVAAVDGGQHSVDLTPNALQHIRGNDVYHNHPNGSTLSTTDVITCAEVGAGSISAVSKNTGKTYTLKATSKANRNGLSAAMQNDEGKLIAQWQAKVDSMKGRKYSSKASWERQVNKHWENIMGDWMGQNVSKFGYTYTIKK